MKMKSKMKLEEGTAARLVVTKGKKEVKVFDTEQPGLFLRKFASGAASYGVRFRVHGKSRQQTLYDVVPGIKGILAKARKAAADVRYGGRRGEDPVQEARDKRAAARALGSTIAKLVPSFLEDHTEKWRASYYATVKLHLTDHLKPIASKAVKAVTRQDVVNALNEVATKRGKVAADRAKASISTFYTWAIDQGHADATPVQKIKARGSTGGRDRVLSMGELVEVRHALENVNEDYRRIMRLLLLTGQRRNEIGRLPWVEVNFEEKRLELPGGMAGRTKNHRAHLVPLSALAMAQLPERPNPTDPTARTMVFGRRHHNGYSGWGKAKEELDAAITAARKKRGIREPMAPWVVHDLRRSFTTHLGELGIAPPHVVEAIVNHISGHKAGVAGIYNRALYWGERVKALNDWSQNIERLVAKQPVKTAA